MAQLWVKDAAGAWAPQHLDINTLILATGLSAAPGETLQTPDEKAVETPPLDLASLLEEAGWPCLNRSDHSFQVDLEVKDRLLYQASVERLPAGIRLWVCLVCCERDAPLPVRLALSALLLRTGGSVRMARGSVRQTQQGLATGFDALFPGTCGAAELAHGLSALSVACDLFGREVEALAQDAVLAERYLSMCFARGHGAG
jgi:hypothetical protein